MRLFSPYDNANLTSELFKLYPGETGASILIDIRRGEEEGSVLVQHVTPFRGFVLPNHVPGRSGSVPGADRYSCILLATHLATQRLQADTPIASQAQGS
jgi:hypothetical protein